MEAATAAPPASSSTSGEGRSPDEEKLATQAKEADARAGGEPLPGEGPEEAVEQDPALPPLRMVGEGKQLTLAIGGGKPTKSEVKLRGGSIEIDSGEFAKGEFVDVVARCRVRGVHIEDHFDRQTGEVTQTIRRHILVIENIERVD